MLDNGFRNSLQAEHMLFPAVIDGAEHFALRSAAVQLLGVGPQAREPADDMPHLIQRMIGASHARQVELLAELEFRVDEQRLLCLQIVDPP